MATSCSVAIGSSVGGPTGATCISYSNCELGCCDKSYTACTGSPTFDCAPLGIIPCDLEICCSWFAGPPAHCGNIACGGFGLDDPEDCRRCGCTANDTCTAKACASLAGGYKNPDMCSGCDTCPGTWNVDLARILPWAVYVTTQVAFAGGQVRLNSYRLTAPSILGPGTILGPGQLYY